MARRMDFGKLNQNRKVVERGSEQRSEAALQNDAEQNRLAKLTGEQAAKRKAKEAKQLERMKALGARRRP